MFSFLFSPVMDFEAPAVEFEMPPTVQISDPIFERHLYTIVENTAATKTPDMKTSFDNRVSRIAICFSFVIYKMKLLHVITTKWHLSLDIVAKLITFVIQHL